MYSLLNFCKLTFLFILGFIHCNNCQSIGWNDASCGLSFQNKVIGGKHASLGEHPWIARLMYSGSGGNVYLCGGALITIKHVVTAAHCTQINGHTLKVVRLGENFVDEDKDCSQGTCADPVQDIHIEKIFVHSQFKTDDGKADIAMLLLTAPAIFSKWVKTICMPTPGQFPPLQYGDKLIAAGWGVKNVETKAASKYLLTVTLPIVDEEECSAVFDKAVTRQYQICAGGVKGKDTCAGDSGGPLMKVLNDDNSRLPRMYLLGVTSFGSPDCGSGNPGVYTRVSNYVTWMTETLKMI